MPDAAVTYAVQADETDRLIAALGPVLERHRRERARLASHEYEKSLLLLKAFRLCPTVDLCERYLRGEHVPLSALDQGWAKAYGLR